MNKPFLNIFGLIIGTILYVYLTHPILYNFLNPVGFWQNIVMIFFITLPVSFLTTVFIIYILNGIYECISNYMR